MASVRLEQATGARDVLGADIIVAQRATICTPRCRLSSTTSTASGRRTPEIADVFVHVTSHHRRADAV
jgi:hypothetical protein